MTTAAMPLPCAVTKLPTGTFSPLSRQPSSRAPTGDHGDPWAAWVSAIADGDPGALASLFDAARPWVYAVVLRIVGGSSDAEETVLEVFHQVWRTASAWDPTRGSVRAWLGAISRSRAIDLKRRLERVRTYEAPLDHEPLSRFPCGSGDPEGHSLGRERRGSVRSALAQLPPSQRQAIELAFFEGLSYRQVAKHLGEPEGTIKSRIRFGIKRLEALIPPTAPRAARPARARRR